MVCGARFEVQGSRFQVLGSDIKTAPVGSKTAKRKDSSRREQDLKDLSLCPELTARRSFALKLTNQKKTLYFFQNYALHLRYIIYITV